MGLQRRAEVICEKCGDKFLAGGMSKYCYDCKVIRRREIANAMYARKRQNQDVVK